MDEFRVIKYKSDSALYAERIYSDRLKVLSRECPQCPPPPRIISATGEMYRSKLVWNWHVAYSCPIHGEIRSWSPDVESLTQDAQAYALANKQRPPEYYFLSGRPVKIDYTEDGHLECYALDLKIGELKLAWRLYSRITKADDEDVEAVSEEEFLEKVDELRKEVEANRSV